MPTTVFFATNRAPIAGAGAAPYFGLDAAPGATARLHTGQAEVTTATGAEAPRPILRVSLDPASAAPVAPAIAAWAAAAIAGEQDAVLFLHGFSNSWMDSIARAGQLRDFYAQPEGDTARPFAILAFGWPSDGKVSPPNVHYPADRRDAAAAGSALAALLAQVAEVAGGIRAKGLRLHLIVHSMGNWALRHGLLAYAPPAGHPPLFDEALLTGADEDADALTTPGKLGTLPRLAGRITAHVNDGDAALLISQGINGVARLGLHWPMALPAAGARDDAAVRVSPCIIEQNEINLTSHQYYRNNPVVRRDVIAVLEGHPQATIRARMQAAEGGARYVLYGAPQPPPVTVLMAALDAGQSSA